MVTVDRFAEAARQYEKALPADSVDQVKQYLWDLIDREDAGFRYVDTVTNWKCGGCLGLLGLGLFNGLGMFGVLGLVAAYTFAVLPVKIRNWSVTPEYERRITRAVNRAD